MASKQLSRVIDKLETVLQSQKSAVGSIKAANILNDLVAIQQFVQENATSLQNIPVVQRKIDQLKEALGMPVEKGN